MALWDALPAAFRRNAREDEARDTLAARGSTIEDRARILVALCRMAAESIAQHPDPQRALDWQDPLSPEAQALLERLRARHRRRG